MHYDDMLRNSKFPLQILHIQNGNQNANEIGLFSNQTTLCSNLPILDKGIRRRNPVNHALIVGVEFHESARVST